MNKVSYMEEVRRKMYSMNIQYKVRDGLENSDIDFIPKPGIEGSAGYDLVYVPDLSYLDDPKHKDRHRYSDRNGQVTLFPGQNFSFPTGIHISLPDHVMAQVCSRSGLAVKQNLIVLNAPGIIDPGYHGEVKVILYNADRVVQVIEPYTRIAQLIFVPFFTPILELNHGFDSLVSVRGSNGFGSTGTEAK